MHKSHVRQYFSVFCIAAKRGLLFAGNNIKQSAECCVVKLVLIYFEIPVQGTCV